ncbi:hypothetical protein Poli38472_000057 [Pythium oligandrum]|uniref:Calponin-homology (CH) domain-containing protein n=1 Tax=Pythium oligandrum TaxID=41045 RepID=A0A8K1FE09_PYTOL|nr:hypothetical protein Poli38472_000057 [Pythium oligandrum]|eukprot:TMW60015.1 hypothetical protein Poli38472_000057 [Pythium oligandrum]
MGPPPHRKLVHWINSLPLAACALVDSLLDLRHGDVLQAIVAWLQMDARRQKPPREREEAVVEVDARTQVHAITRYVAQRCRSEDGEAMYLLNEARCASRVLAGDVEAIAAVVSVLRRLVQERQEKEAQAVEEAHALARQELVVFSHKAKCAVASAQGSSRHAFTRKSSFIHVPTRPQKSVSVRTAKPYATDFDAFAAVFSIKQSAAGEPASWQVWDMLRHIQNQHVRPVEQAAHGVMTNTSTMAKKLERESDMVRKRRLYLTSEQIEATTAWLKLLGVSLSPTSSSIFDDPLRNGSVLCELLQRAFKGLHHSLELRYPPKTLGDMRHNISCSLQGISHLEGLHIPANYLGSQAVEATVMGDKQSIFAVLWHLWQYWEDLQRRGIKDKTEESAANNDVENTPPVVNSQEEKTHLTRSVEAPKRAKPAAMEAFLMDVSASKLAEEETYSSWDCRNDTNSRLDIPWGGQEWSNDLFPSPRHSFESPSGAMTMEDISRQADIVPIAREVPQMEHIDHSRNQETSISQPEPARSETSAKEIDSDPGLVARTTSPRPLEDKPAVLSIPKVENIRTIRRETSKAIEVSQEDIEGILCWFKLIGIRLKQPEDFQNQTARLAEFQSGVVLCDIVEKVEHLRRIDGVSRAEKSVKANALHNIEKALSILQKKKTMPLHLIRLKRSVYDGDRYVILSLLLQIRKAYGYHLKGKSGKLGVQRRHPMHQDAADG